MKENAYKSLYKKLLGDDYDILPKAVRMLHDLQNPKSYVGIACVKRGTNIFARMLAAILRLPRTADEVPITVNFVPDNDKELWSRYFSKDQFVTIQWVRKNYLYERLSAITLVFKPVVSDDCLTLVLERVYLLGLPLPAVLRPKIIARESEHNGKFCFYDHVSLPFIGLLITYHGTLEDSKMEHGLNLV